MRVLNPNRRALFENGRIPFGAYSGEMKSNPNTLTFVERRAHRKSWLFVGHFSESAYAGFAIADAGYVGNAFAYIFLPETNTFLERSVIRPFGFSNDHVPEIESSWALGPFRIETDATSYRAAVKHKGMDLKIEIDRAPDRGVSFVCPSDRGHVFTYKNVGIESRLEFAGAGKSFSESGMCGAIDFSNGFPPRNTTWRWACAIGATESGRQISLNAVSDHNGGVENIAWVDGEPKLLSVDSAGQELGIELSDLKFDLSELGSRGEKLNLGLVQHDFKQSFGPCSGTIFGERFNAVGVFENHFSKW